MSRTVKGSKGPGCDYQGHKGARTGYTPSGGWWKRYGARVARHAGKQECTDEQ